MYIFIYTIIVIFLQECVIHKYLNIRNIRIQVWRHHPHHQILSSRSLVRLKWHPTSALGSWISKLDCGGSRRLSFIVYSRSFVFHLLVKKLRARDFASFLSYLFLVVISFYCSRCMSRSCKNFRCHRCRTSFIRSTLASKKRSRDYLSIFRSRQKTRLFQMVSQFV